MISSHTLPDISINLMELVVMNIKYASTCMSIYPLTVMKENVDSNHCLKRRLGGPDQKDTEVRDDSDIQHIVIT